MSTRSLRARLDKLGRPPGEDGPVCRWHGTACQMGRRWPLPYEPRVDDDLLDLLADSKRRCGMPVPPHPRDLWAHQDHELVPPEELERKAQEAAALLARLKERNDRIEARIAAGDVNYWEPM